VKQSKTSAALPAALASATRRAEAPPHFDGGSQRWTVLAAALIAAAGLAAYGNSFGGPFVFDDLPAIVENATIRSLSPLQNALRPPPGGSTVEGRPLVNLSLALNYAWSDLNVNTYHAMNLAIHLAAALTLFGLVRRTLLLPRWNGRFQDAAPVLAIAVALIWTVHPLQTQSVTYIVQRAESLMGLCYLLTLYCFVRGATSNRSLPWYAAAVAACAAGMASKEVAVTAPLVALLYDRAFLSSGFREALRRRWPAYAGLALTWILLAALVLPTGGRSGTAGYGQGVAAWDYFRAQPEFIVRYLRLCVWPRPLVLDYGTQLSSSALRAGVSGLFLLALLLGSVWALFKRPWLGFLGLAFFLILAPSSSFVPIVTQTAAEHRMYLPLAIVVALCVLGGYFAFERLLSFAELDDETRGLARKVVPALLVAGLAVGLVYMTRQRNDDYRLALLLWRRTVDHWPYNARAHYNLGAEQLDAGQDRDALTSFSNAVKFAPHDADGYIGLGNVYRKNRSTLRAIENYTKALRLRPDSAQAYHSRGLVYGQAGRQEKAVADYTRAIELDPTRGESLVNRAAAYSLLNQHELAIADCDRALEIDRRDVLAYYNRSNVYAAMGDLRRGIADMTRALELQPQYVPAYIGRARHYLAVGENDEALYDYTRAIDLSRSYVPVFYERAAALAAVGRHENALEDIDYALYLDPEHAEGYRARAIERFQLQQYDGAWKDVAEFRRRGGRLPAEFLEELTKASGRSE